MLDMLERMLMACKIAMMGWCCACLEYALLGRNELRLLDSRSEKPVKVNMMSSDLKGVIHRRLGSKCAERLAQS